jgi:hypothetical protein
MSRVGIFHALSLLLEVSTPGVVHGRFYPDELSQSLICIRAQQKEEFRLTSSCPPAQT